MARKTRIFKLQLRGEAPIEIVADSKLDALCEAMDVKRQLNNYRVIDFREVSQTNNIINSIRFEQQFNNVFA